MSPTLTLAPGRPKVNKKQTRKPFLAPKLKEEASLEDVTLLSGQTVTSRPTGNQGGRFA